MPFGLKERQVTFDWHTYVPPRELWILFIDDSATEDARALRAQVASELPGLLDNRDRWCSAGNDPAVYTPATIDVLLVPLSRPDAALHPGNHPELALDTPNALSKNNGAWENAVANAIVSLENDVPAPLDILAAINRWDQLIAGTAVPSDAPTETFLQTVLVDPYPTVLLATTRDQEIENSTSPRLLDFHSRITTLFRSETECSNPDQPHAPRQLEQTLGIRARWCDDAVFASAVACRQFFAQCLPGHPVQAPTGDVRCRVLAELDDNSSCPTSVGWVDPFDQNGRRTPQFIATAPTPLNSSPREHRLCEILPLAGAAKLSCERDVDCSDCKPGWCWHEPFSADVADWDWRSRDCAEDGMWSISQIRLVHGSHYAAYATIHVACDIE